MRHSTSILRRWLMLGCCSAMLLTPYAGPASSMGWLPGGPGFGGGNGGNGGTGGTGGGAPLPLIGLSGLGQVTAAGGAFLLWRRRKKRAQQKQ